MSVSGNPDIITSGLILHLDAADIKSYPRTGTVWYDRSENGRNGTMLNGVSFSNGTLGFDGSNDYIDLGTTNFISTTAAFTTNIWVNLMPRAITGSQSDFHRIITLKSQGTSTFGIAYITQVQFGYEGLYVTNNNGWVRSKTSYYPPTNTWGMLTLTYNGNGSTNIANFKMYWNTNQLTFDPNNGFVPGLTTDANFLGARQSGDIQIFKGRMANFQIYNRLLSQQEILQNYNATKSRFGL